MNSINKKSVQSCDIVYIVYINHPNFYLRQNVVQRNILIVEFRTQILSTIFNDTTSQGQQQTNTK